METMCDGVYSLLGNKIKNIIFSPLSIASYKAQDCLIIELKVLISLSNVLVNS